MKGLWFREGKQLGLGEERREGGKRRGRGGIGGGREGGREGGRRVGANGGETGGRGATGLAWIYKAGSTRQGRIYMAGSTWPDLGVPLPLTFLSRLSQKLAMSSADEVPATFLLQKLSNASLSAWRGGGGARQISVMLDMHARESVRFC